MSIFIGGDTTELIYNFSTKIEGSMTECPMKLYFGKGKDLLEPNSKVWNEATQINYDKLKQKDEIPSISSTSITGEKAQLLIELDLNGLCNLYGGSNSTLKDNIKKIHIKCYGNNTNGWKMYVRQNENNTWINWAEGIKDLENNSSATYPYAVDNKVYILLIDSNSATLDTPSKIYLSYVDIILKLNRQPDIIEPIQVDLSNEWSILVKGISMGKLDDNAKAVSFYVDRNNYFYISWHENALRFCVRVNGIIKYICFKNEKFKSKFKCINVLLQYKDKKFTMYTLCDTLEKKELNITESFTETMFKLYLGKWAEGNVHYLNGFMEDIQILPMTFTDEEAGVILKGRNTVDSNDKYYNQLAEIYQNPNLIPNFKDKRWNRNPYTSVSDDGKTFNLNATEGTWNTSNVEFDVMPNNKYQLKFTKDKANHYIDIAEKYNKSDINITFCIGVNQTGEVIKDFVVSDKTTKLKVVIACNKEGAYKVSNLELRRLD